MKYYHCPRTVRGRPYGCGYGPVNMTKAVLDLGKICPDCKKELKVVRSKPQRKMAVIQQHLDAAATAAELFGPAAGERYVRNHTRRRK